MNLEKRGICELSSQDWDRGQGKKELFEKNVGSTVDLDVRTSAENQERRKTNNKLKQDRPGLRKSEMSRRSAIIFDLLLN